MEVKLVLVTKKNLFSNLAARISKDLSIICSKSIYCLSYKDSILIALDHLDSKIWDGYYQHLMSLVKYLSVMNLDSSPIEDYLFIEWNSTHIDTMGNYIDNPWHVKCTQENGIEMLNIGKKINLLPFI